MSEIKQTYRDVEITYFEMQNEWQAEGYRSKQSLKELREAIDRHLDKPERKKAERTQAIRVGYGRPELVTITSVSEDGSIWYTNVKGERSKENGRWGAKNFFVLDVNSKVLLNRWTLAQEEKERIEEQQASVLSQLVKLDVSTL